MKKEEFQAARAAMFGENPQPTMPTLLNDEQLMHGFANIVEQMTLQKALRALDTSYYFQRQIADRIMEEFKHHA